MSARVFVSLTVLLETGWLLGSRFALSRRAVARALTAVIDLDSVSVPNAEAVRWALDRFGKGGDLGDMLHVVAATGCQCLVTFDRRIARSAGRNAPVLIETLR